MGRLRRFSALGLSLCLILSMFNTNIFESFAETDETNIYQWEYTGSRYNNGTDYIDSNIKLQFRWITKSGNALEKWYYPPDGYRPYPVSTGMFNAVRHWY